MRAYGMTDIGQNRSVNQDYIFYSKDPIGNLPNLFIVADGMGGHKAGDLASSFAVDSFLKKVKQLSYGSPITIIGEAIAEVNRKVYEKAKTSPDYEGMGTTFVVAVISGSALYVANVGDSRLYIVGDTIRQITRDHSLVEEMVSLGEIDKKEARNHEKKNIITRAVGVSERVMADFFEVELEENEAILLCSDGLTNMIEDADILHIVSGRKDEKTEMSSEERTKRKVLRLIELANKNGGRDNISVILLEPDEFEVHVC